MKTQMTLHYLDIETCRKTPENDERDGFDPHKGKIITIQYQPIDKRTGQLTGRLTILKEWELSEKTMIQQFKPVFLGYNHPRTCFEFTPVGYNLKFEIDFLRHKLIEHCALDRRPHLLWTKKPIIDLFSAVIIANNCNFKGAKLNNFSSKIHDGSIITQLYENQKYDELTGYIKNEAEGFSEILKKLIRTLPEILTSKSLNT